MDILTVSRCFIFAIAAIPLMLVMRGRLRMDIAALLIVIGLGLGQFFGLEILGPAGQPNEAVKAIHEAFKLDTIIRRKI